MIYEFEITTTTSHTSTNLKKSELKLYKGMIHRLDIISFPGSMGVLYISLFHGGHQLFPSNTGSYFRLGGETFSFMERYNLKSEPFILDAYSYLYHVDGVSYNHDCLVRVGLLKRDEVYGQVLIWDEEQIEGRQQR